MNRREIAYRLIILLLLNTAGVYILWSQETYDTSYTPEAIKIREGIKLFTDRDMYAVNEKVFFRAFYNDPFSGEKSWSKVLYLEMVTPQGQAVVNGKFRLGMKGSSGYLTIPGDILTGNYYLRAYTRWMRNFGASNYCYVPLKIINPFKDELLAEQSPSPSTEVPGNITPLLVCKPDREIYSPGEEVSLDIFPAEEGMFNAGEFCLTVAPEGLIDSIPDPLITEKKKADNSFIFNFLPDIRGISISGSVINIKDQSPSALTRLHFSLQGKNPGYFAALTDEQGRFILTVPERTGLQEMFVAGEPSADHSNEIRIDQDYETDPLPFSPEPFILSEGERKAAIQMVLNMQLKDAFGLNDVHRDPEKADSSKVRFYGTPDLLVTLDDYIKLPTMEEVFLNLVPDVFIQYKRKQPHIKIESLNKSIYLYPALVFLDRVPIFDLKSLLMLNPSRIERIEVIHDIYVLGNLMYGGIIDITSVSGSRAEMDLPEGSYFFDYQTFHPGDLYDQLMDTNVERPDSSLSYRINAGERIPDTRNTLKWIPDLSPGPEHLINLKFTAGSFAGDYRILVRGVSGKGEFIYGFGSFRVQK